MIDIENYIVSQISSALSSTYSSTYPGLVVYSTEVEIPESFPCVTVVASDNFTLRSTREFGKNTENHAHITFTVNVYANNGTGRKETAKTLFQAIDLILQNFNFTRLMASPMPNIDRTVARYTGRYEANVGEPIAETIDNVEVYTFPVFKN